MRKTVTKEEALVSMASLCARSEQCEADIYKKLLNKGLSHGDIHEIIEELINREFIDNARFARSFANDKVRFSAWGRNKIRAALMAKRISSVDTAEALAQIDEKEYAAALSRAVKSKVSGLDLSVYEDRLKLYRHLLSRGFESSFASSAVKKLSSE